MACFSVLNQPNIFYNSAKRVHVSASVKYRFSFTAASLMVRELSIYARLLIDNDYKINTLKHESLNKAKAKTGVREFAEIKLRLSCLSNYELGLLAESDFSNQKLIAYLSCCRTYAYLRDFVTEVMMEKVALYDYKLTDRDYIVFFNKKCIDHMELEVLADSTKAKIKQVIFKMLQQSGLIDSVQSKNIVIPIVDAQVINAIKKTNPNDLALFLMQKHV